MGLVVESRSKRVIILDLSRIASLYDVTLNTGRLGFARTAEAIAQLALQHRHALVQTSAE
jgi:hypothetical protein